ncbi:hypothetical protein JGU72_13865 [Antrihabitans sp. YC2-6]|nr:hypothetical protein [Antrihabitans sp. YC2-6]
MNTQRTPEPAVPAAKPSRTWLKPAVAAAAAVVLLTVAAGVAFLSYSNHQTDEREATRQEYIQVARQAVLNLTTIDPETVKEDVDRILADATGEFQAEFDGRIEPFVSIVREAKVATHGEIIAAGLESESDDGGVVLVAAKSMVTNAGSDEPQPRNFRLRVSVTDVDGRLATSKVEFVP